MNERNQHPSRKKPEPEYEYEDEIELMDYLNVIWKRKWLIIIPTFILVVLAGVYSLLQTPVWKVESLIQPAKFTIQTEGGQFEEILPTSSNQIAGQINEKSYNHLVAAELNLDIRKFPQIEAETLQDTNLVRLATKTPDVNKVKSVHLALFKHLKRELDKKVDVETKDIDTQIETKNNSINHKNLVIKDTLNEIKLNKIEKNKLKQQIVTAKNKLNISKERIQSIMEEMKTVKKRIDNIEVQLRNALAKKKEEGDSISLLLYSNEIQHNLRYYNTLDEKLSNEKITQENLNLTIKEKEENIKQIDTQIEKLETNIDKVENKIENIKSQIELLKDKKARIDYAQLIKEPTSSLGPVAPKKKRNVVIAGVLGLFIFTLLAFFIEYIQKQKSQEESR